MDRNESVEEVLALVRDRCEAYLKHPLVASDPNLSAIVEALRPFCESDFPGGMIKALADGLDAFLNQYGSRKELYWILWGNRNTLRRRIRAPQAV